MSDERLGVKSLPPELRPRERLQQYGARALSDAELLAILLGSGTSKYNVIDLAQLILQHAGGLAQLTQLSYEQITQLDGIGPSRACTVLSLGELARRLSLLQAGGLVEKIGGSADAGRYFNDLASRRGQECFMVLYLDSKHRVLEKKVVSVGTLNEAPVHPRDVFHYAVHHNACCIICGHNHPSNDLTPSRADDRLTERLQAAADLLGIDLLDHIIVGHEGLAYYSYREHGRIIQ
ncbi:RadC family protein [Peptococcus simiae]|uniref:RadC family protein n=1 Tax=Peptococcus simiae TaxID=1643805 RepID=UPI00397FE50A